MMKPCATPTSTLATVMARVLAADAGVSRLAVDQSRKDSASMARPPYFCAAKPPGTCTEAAGQLLVSVFKHSVKESDSKGRRHSPVPQKPADTCTDGIAYLI
jgi:hypothetical protein